MRIPSLVLVLAVSLLGAQMSGAGKPNVIVFMADDIGLGDLSHYQQEHTGNVVVATPNIDRLMTEGLRFSDAHSSASLCAPTRFSMMTGNFSYRNSRPFGVWSPDADSGIEPNFTTAARIAKAGGYQTAFFGKWGLGSSLANRKKPSPELSEGALHFGFDYACELPQGIQNTPFAFYENRKWMPLKPDSILKEIGTVQIGYEGDPRHTNEAGPGDSNWDPSLAGPLLAGKAVSYIAETTAEHPDAPFFIYYCSQAVHVPHTPPKELDGIKIAGATANTHRDMIRELDVQVGMLIKELKRTKTYDNTLFIFTSDNGGTSMGNHDSSNGLRGKKGSIYEGGHRVPFVAVWPGKIAPNTESREPVVGHDVVATIAALVGQPLDPNKVKDSLNLLPIFIGQKTELPHRYLIHQSASGPTFALRDGPWKLILLGKGGKKLPDAQKGKTKKGGQKGVVTKDGEENTEGGTFNPAALNPIALFNLDENLAEDDAQNQITNPKQSERIKQMMAKYLELRASGESTLSK